MGKCRNGETSEWLHFWTQIIYWLYETVLMLNIYLLYNLIFSSLPRIGLSQRKTGNGILAVASSAIALMLFIVDSEISKSLD